MAKPSQNEVHFYRSICLPRDSFKSGPREQEGARIKNGIVGVPESVVIYRKVVITYLW